jgi:hypothetical protein
MVVGIAATVPQVLFDFRSLKYSSHGIVTLPLAAFDAADELDEPAVAVVVALDEACRIAT